MPLLDISTTGDRAVCDNVEAGGVVNGVVDAADIVVLDWVFANVLE
jgi:hypothetical protein